MSAATAPGASKGIPAEAVLAFAILSVLAILIVPLPPLVLDLLLAINIALSVLMLLIALGLTKALDFSVFPSLLLITTLFRLALNVATTRLILLHGGEGAGAAGHVIETFGRFAIGGSLIVGAVVFLILLIVNFAVITKGSGRVSEVAARFTLDALPGKQMSIDADLAAGIIDDREARARRASLEQETEFFGSMDGASKFVRGDAVAGLAITGVNILGGLLAGVLRDNMAVAQAVETYTLLTVGDGLVSQMPALLVSTAAGILVTRAAGADLGTQVGSQIFGSPRALKYSAGVLGMLAVLPGLPFFVFGALAGLCLVMSRSAEKKASAPVKKEPVADKKGPEKLQDLLAMDALELEVGYGLLSLIDLEKGGELPARITALRRQLATDLGVVLPSVHLRDNLRLEPAEYRIRLRGQEIGSGTLYMDRLLCLGPSGEAPAIDGISSKEPAFGLPAVWVLPTLRPEAEARGFTLVDPCSVIATHLSELLRKHAWELVGRQETQELLAACAKDAPKLVEDAVPGAITLGELVRVLRALLKEGVSVRDLRSILEAVADASVKSKETHFLVEQARKRLQRQITAKVAEGTTVHAITLERAAEEMLRSAVGVADGEPTLAPDVETARRLIAGLETKAATLSANGRATVLLAPQDLRRPLYDFASRFIPDLHVVTARELAPGTHVSPVGSIALSAPPPFQRVNA